MVSAAFLGLLTSFQSSSVSSILPSVPSTESSTISWADPLVSQLLGVHQSGD